MQKKSSPAPANWVNNLRALMDDRGLNPRSLSIKAGLNPTAVRDMLEGRSRFPRYDTAVALANALDTTLMHLMSDDEINENASAKGTGMAEDLDLLTEIIARLQEISAEQKKKIPARDFAAMAATIYRRLQDEGSKHKTSSIKPQILDLMDFESLRKKRTKR